MWLPALLKSDISFLLELVQINSFLPDLYPEVFELNDTVARKLKRSLLEREYVLKCVSKNGCSLRLACTKIKDDYDIVFTAIKQNGLAFQ